MPIMLLNWFRGLAKSAAAVLICLTMSVVASAEEPRRVLLLNSYGSEFEPFRFFVAKFRAELTRQSPQRLEYYDVSLLSARFAEQPGEDPFVAYLNALFSHRHIDLVVAVGAPAARFVQKYRGKLFSSTPMLLTAMDQRRLIDIPLSNHDAAVVLQVDRLATIQNILDLLPDTNKVAIVLGNSPNSLFWRDTMIRELEPLRGKVEFSWLNELSFDQTLKYVASMPPRAAIYFGPVAIDSTNVPPEAGSALSAIHAVASAPLFGTFDAYLGQGIVGGPLLSLSDLARKAATESVALLHGQPPAKANITSVSVPVPMFDWRELQRWNISEARLPPGSRVLFREPSVWARYSWYMASIGAFCVLATLTIVALLINRNRLHRAQEETRALSDQLLNAHDTERARIAHELHDDMSQRLAALAMRMGSGVKRLKSSGLRGLYHDLVRLTEDVHALSYRLHPSALADFGAQAAIESECTHFSQTSSIDVHTDFARVPEKLPQEVSLHLFRIVQEALRNAARHAGATRVDVSLNSAKGGLRLLISDNGNGFNPAKKQSGIGLSSMRYRAKAIGGTCEILSELGGGCRIVVSVPIDISNQPSHLANFDIGADAESGKALISIERLPS